MKVKPRPYKSKFPKKCLYVSDDEIEVKEINFEDSNNEDAIGIIAIKDESFVKENKKH